jgi:hypothetical protein
MSNAQCNVLFESTVSNLEALMDACFPREPKAHVEAWRYHQLEITRDARRAAIDAALMAEVGKMVEEFKNGLVC